MPGRECHVDGLLGDLNTTLPLDTTPPLHLKLSSTGLTLGVLLYQLLSLRQHLVYKPPPDFVGHVQLQFVIYRAQASGFECAAEEPASFVRCQVKDEILGVESSRGAPITIAVDVEVAWRLGLTRQDLASIHLQPGDWSQ